MLEHAAFRFLDLPKELRFMVYENLDITAKELHFLPLENGYEIQRRDTTSQSGVQPGITVSLQTLPVQIFSTCQLVYSESVPFLTRKLNKICASHPTRISIDADCLYAGALARTQNLLCALLDNLNSHPFFSPNLTAGLPLPKPDDTASLYPPEIHQWLAHTTHLLLSQRPPPCPFAGFMGTSTYPTVRLVIDVPSVCRSTSHHGRAMESSSTAPLHTRSVTSQLSQLYSGLVEHTRRLKHVKSAAIVFGEDERVMFEGCLVTSKGAALDFGLCRVVE